MQISVLLGVFLALLVGETYSAQGEQPGRLWGGNLETRQVLLFGAGVLVIVWSLLRMQSNLLMQKLRKNSADRKVLRLPARVDAITRLAILAIFGILLTAGGWTKLVCPPGEQNGWMLVRMTGLILPFALMLVIQWSCFYPVHRHIREYMVSGQLAEGLAARPVWSRRQYLIFQIRHNLLMILVPVGFILIWRDGVDAFWRMYRLDSRLPAEGYDVLVFAGAGMVFLLSPLLLRRIWKTRTLPAGPLREKLETFCRSLKLGYRDILLWDTYSGIANAAVMGVIRPVRYVLLSDAVIENVRDEQIEAVFGHEAGHVRHHHILFLVLFLFGSGGWFTFAGEWINDELQSLGRDMHGTQGGQNWISAGIAAVLGVLWFLLFAWVSRRFERQADVHAAKAVAWNSKRTPGERMPTECESRESPCVWNDTLDYYGAAVTAQALERIAMLNGMSIHTKSWRHSSIASRMEFLRRLAGEPGLLARFEKRVRWLQITIAAAALTGAAVWWHVMQRQSETGMG